MFRYEKGSDGIVIVTMDMEGKVNKMGGTFLSDMKDMVEKLEKDDFKGMILTSAKETFFAGADLNFFISEEANSPKIVFEFIEEIKSYFRRMEKLGKPIVAAINGTALGGGFEICLSCSYRIVLDKPKVKLGLPEVSWGLLPGGGGTVRLIHMLGPQIAVPYILEGKQLSPKEALDLHMIDEIVSTPEELMQKSKDWILKNPNYQKTWNKIPGGPFDEFLSVAPAMLYKKTKGAYPAQNEVLEVAAQTLAIEFDAALRFESRALTKLVTGKEAKNMIKTFFFQLNELNAGGSKKYTVKKLGILGGGMMGKGIATVAALAGIEVIVKEVDPSVKLGPNILVTTNYEDLKGCDLIIEAVFEDIQVKANVTKEAEKYTDVFASNTSSIPITKLAEASKKPENFIGIHFFSPVEKMKLVEIIVGKKTSEETLAKAFDFAQQLKKIPIIVNDSPGFFTTRVIATYINEAVEMLVEGVHPARIERVARQAGFPAGPFAVWDEVSQKLWLMISKDHKVADLLVNKYKRGGRAYGGGIYEYPAGGKKYIWPEIIKLYYKPEYQITDEEIKDRLLYIQTLEALKCVEEGVIRHPRDANIGSIYGIGYPPTTGGVLQHYDERRLLELKSKYGWK